MVIFHIIVAFDQIKEIQELLYHIDLQDETKHKVILIDNSETLNVEIKSICNIFNSKGNFEIRYYKTIRNLGSACGFALGMQIAMNSNADWVWLHDHDGYPLPNCLKNIKKHLKDESNIYSPKIIDENNNYLSVFNGVYDKYGNLIHIALKHEETEVDVAGTAGLFISKKIIDKIGVYNYHNYFIGCEDFDFCLRSKKAGFKTIILEKTLYYHPNKWEIDKSTKNKKIFNYLGEISQNKLLNRSSSIINYHIKYLHYCFILSFFYSMLKVFVKKIFSYNVDITATYKCYLIALYYRYFRHENKIVIQIENYIK